MVYLIITMGNYLLLIKEINLQIIKENNHLLIKINNLFLTKEKFIRQLKEINKGIISQEAFSKSIK